VSAPAGDGIVDGRAWRDFCARLTKVGDQMLGPEFPGTARDRAEGYRHLANQVVAWLSWAIGYPDATHPAFFRQNDQVVRWGGPNVDQVTRRARISGDGTYEITGSMGSCEDFILTVKDGDMHMERYGILSETLASELGIGSGDDFSITLSATEPVGGADRWVALQPDAQMLNLREYYFDWQPRPPAIVTIERVDAAGTAPPLLTPERVAVMLDEAATIIERSITYWNDYLRSAKAELTPNTMGAPRHNPGGSSLIHYSFGFFELEPDQALLLEASAPDARFWDVQLYTMGWFEPFDYANHITSLNHTQSRLSADGCFRAVVAHDDPQAPNWLDTEGRREGMITHRWIDTRSEPTITSRLVGLDEVRSLLPTDTPEVDVEMRRDEVRRRQRHVAWRYRT
jgi:hypothetical protein